MAAAKKAAASGGTPLDEGKTRSFRCIRGCYWEGTRYRSADEAKVADEISFTGPGEIPASFQFDNWEEI